MWYTVAQIIAPAFAPLCLMFIGIIAWRVMLCTRRGYFGIDGDINQVIAKETNLVLYRIYVVLYVLYALIWLCFFVFFCSLIIGVF